MKKSLLIWFLTWIMILSWCWDPNSPVERGYSDLPPIPYCEKNWWTVDHWEEEWIDTYFCLFDDDSYCTLEDFANKKCNKWDNLSENFDYDTQAREICIENGGLISIDDKYNELCIYQNDTFCDIDDILCMGLTELGTTTIEHENAPNMPWWKWMTEWLIRDSEWNFESYKRIWEWIFYGYSWTIVLKWNYSGWNLDWEWYRYWWKDTIHAHEIYENWQSKELLECDDKCKKISWEKWTIKHIINIIDVYNSLLYPSN